jgi:hypothetical protein
MSGGNRLPGMSGEEQQRQFCEANGYAFDLTRDEEKIGVAVETLGKSPINGLRHPRHGGTSGWYIWCGEDFSDEPNFFSPLHAGHLKQKCPEIIKLLGLPPGYRFLTVGDHLDVWYEKSLLTNS